MRSRRRGALARELLGVPTVPRGRVVTATTRLRAAVGRVHAALAPPPVRIIEGLFGMLDHRVLVAICACGVPDALDAPVRPADLAARVRADPAALERLLRYAATRGWVRIDRLGHVRPTRVTAFLRADHPGGWRAWVDFAGGDDVLAAVARLAPDGSTEDVFAAANGSPFFAWMAAHPERGEAFDRAMAAGGRMHGLALAAALDWSGTRRVCDVGGGNGALLSVLLDLVPSLSGTVFDLPDVVARAVVHPRLDAAGGDAFVAVPSGFDCYLLVSVLHDWNDDDARRLLATVVRAAAGARVVVVDQERTVVPRADLAAGTDVLMAALTRGGHERGADQFAALGDACGVRLQRSVRLASGALAHEFVAR
jgi:hypothetical protein